MERTTSCGSTSAAEFHRASQFRTFHATEGQDRDRNRCRQRHRQGDRAQFLREGAKVAIADINLDAARAAADELDPSGRRLRVAMDVTDEAQVDAGVDEVSAASADRCPRFERGHPDRRAGRPVRVQRLEEDARHPPRRRVPDDPRLPCAACTRRAAAARSSTWARSHSKEASKLKAPYVTAKHGLLGLAKTVAKEGAEHGVRANVICPGFVRTPLVEKQIPEQAKELGISEDEVIRNVMLKETVDGEFTTLDDVAPLRRLSRRLPIQRAHRPVDRRQPRLVDAVNKRSHQQ